MAHHILQELNFRVRRSGGELHGAAEITPYAHAPGTPHLRVSVLATWADMLSGLLAAQGMASAARSNSTCTSTGRRRARG